MIKRLFLTLALSLTLAFTAHANEQVYKRTVPGLTGYAHVSPIVTPDGSYKGFVATSMHHLAIFNAAGILIDSVSMSSYARQSIARLSLDGDTIVVYTQQDSSGHEWWGSVEVDFILPRITKTLVTDGAVSSSTIDPPVVSYSYPGNAITSIDADVTIAFTFGEDAYPDGLKVRASIDISQWEWTIGTSSGTQLRSIEYPLDLGEPTFQFSSWDAARGDFGEPDTCGVVSISNSTTSVYDDPWNSFSDSWTTFRVAVCDSVLARRVTPDGTSAFIATGDFLPQTTNDEFIYAGRAEDLLGLRDSITNHWGCYRVDDDTISEVWWNPGLWGFSPSHYLPHENLLIGTTGDWTVKTVNCASGEFVDEVTLDHRLYHRDFLLDRTRRLPMLFGTLGDTIYVYNLQTPTDIGDGDGNPLLPNEFTLAQNYPNPFNPTTTISFSLPAASDVQLNVFNAIGRKVKVLTDRRYPAGEFSVTWDGTDQAGDPVASGVYFYRRTPEHAVSSRKMLLLK